MGKPKLEWSPIQLHMENQQKIIHMWCLHGLTVDIEGARAVANFKVIEIVDDSNPYLVLLGIDWAFDMNAIINLNKWSMVFEKNEIWVIVPLDANEGSWYIEPNRDYYEDIDIEHIYKLTASNEDSINPLTDGRINWEKDNSYQSVSDEELEIWKNQLHEVSTLRCNQSYPIMMAWVMSIYFLNILKWIY